MGELLKYGGSGMVCLLEQLFSVVWHEETVPRHWREGLLLICLRKVIGRIHVIIEVSLY